ncbi:MAG: STAS domain-containing protein [Rubrobacteraceae bacterium]|nr:STAS domain-containing protein [Rubrobacteraceae bacterium]
MYGIEVRESGAGLQLELWGEFDLFCIEELKKTFSDLSSCRGPILVDLSGITFLDLPSARELAVRSLLYSHHLTFLGPSPQVMATMCALGLEGWLSVPPGAALDEARTFSGVL